MESELRGHNTGTNWRLLVTELGIIIPFVEY